MGHLLVLNSLALPFLAPFSGLAVVSPSSCAHTDIRRTSDSRLVMDCLHRVHPAYAVSTCHNSRLKMGLTVLAATAVLRGGLGWVVNHCFLVTRASIASATLATRVGCSKRRGEGEG